MPEVSVVIRSKDEADRLRLTLASMEAQAVGLEVIVVDDGSTDHTPTVVAAAASHLPLHSLRHARTLGRDIASNAGAALARGPVLLFMDGDTMAGPDLLARHLALHRTMPNLVARGETWHVRGTRMLLDPDAGTPFPEQADQIASRPAAELARLRVRIDQVRHDFAAVASRASPGVYPGADPRRLFDLELAALRDLPDCAVLWAAASGSNLSVRRDHFLAAGGFDPGIDITGHRELALRMVNQGARMVLVPDARSYHLTHRSGWRDPLRETDWEARFLAVHRRPAVALLAVMWASIARHPALAEGPHITTLAELAAAAEAPDAVAFDAARRRLGLSPMGAAFWSGA